MRVAFLVNVVDRGWEPTDKRLGGTEESIVRWADEMAKRGHEVFVYRNPRVEGDRQTSYPSAGMVTYLAREVYSGGHDVCINIKSSDILPVEPTLYLTNEANAGELDLSPYDGVIWPSEWADDNIPVNNPRKFILPHGYDNTKIYPESKMPKQCLYASSPDRGLETLERIWPSVVDAHPDAHLYVTYGGRISTPNTTCAEFTEEEMNDLYNTSDVWVHPCSGGELFGISGIKAQAAGAIPVYFPTMALQETVKVGLPCSDERDLYETLVALLGDEAAKEKLRAELAKQHYVSWEESTTILLDIITMVL